MPKYISKSYNPDTSSYEIAPYTMLRAQGQCLKWRMGLLNLAKRQITREDHQKIPQILLMFNGGSCCTSLENSEGVIIVFKNAHN
jgi:hypothetical protein